MTTESTAYGTSSLASDEALSARAANRRKTIKWIAVLTGVCIVGALLAVTGVFTPSHTVVVDSALKSSPASELHDDVTCFQSSYIGNESKMMQPVGDLEWSHSARGQPASSFISVDVGTQYQEIMGFGGAFTQASALQFSKLSREKQKEVLALYFDKTNGSAYTFGRVPMGSCDFTSDSYSFDDVWGDVELKHFDMGVTQDTDTLIPFIQNALRVNPSLKLILAPWSPPAWMKRSEPDQTPSMLGSTVPICLREDAREPWALYFSKFISAYKQHGIPFWGLTPQNEPQAQVPWESCMYTAEYQAEFIADFLGPMLERDHPELTLMIFDNNRGSVRQWAEVIYNDPKAAKYVGGMAFHWYGMERFVDGVTYHERLNDTHFVDESRFMLATESANCPGIAYGDQAWFRAQRYGHDIMTDLNNYAAGWVDWNLILDHTGGPNKKGNNCDAPLVLTEDETDFFVQPMYYFIQHFSRFIPPGSHRVKTQVAVRFEKPGDARLFVGYPSMLAACDGSSRQQFQFTEDSKLQVSGTDFCVDMKEIPWQGHQALLVKCQYTQQTWTLEAGTGRIRMSDYCLSLNHGSTQDGVRVDTLPCEDETQTYQQWTFNAQDGTMRSRASSTEQCMTAGYAFVQAAAFVTPEDKKVLVVLNENTEPADFELQVGGMALETTIPQGAIRTFRWE